MIFRAHPKRRSSGFTLLELILAVTITAIVALVLFTSLRVAFDARDRAGDHLAGHDTMHALTSVIRADLEAIPPPTGTLAGPMVGEDEMGSSGYAADILTYTTASVQLQGPDALADLRNVTLRLIDDPDDPRYKLLVREVTDHLLASVEPTPHVQVIARRCLSLDTRYYDGSDWLNDWDSIDQEDALPLAIEIRVVIDPARSSGPADDIGTPVDEDDLLSVVEIVMLPAATASESSGSDGRISF